MGVLPNSGLLYATSMAVPATIVPNSAASHQCPLCHVGSNVAPAAAHLNGFVSELVPSCIDHDMSALRLDSDQPSRNSNSSNSEGTSSDQSSPPNTPLLVQNSYKKSEYAISPVFNSFPEVGSIFIISSRSLTTGFIRMGIEVDGVR